jgi:hypothetical protein
MEISRLTLTAALRYRTTAVQLGHSLTFVESSLNANVDELRITRGVARYSANFTPSTVPSGYHKE